MKPLAASLDRYPVVVAVDHQNRKRRRAGNLLGTREVTDKWNHANVNDVFRAPGWLLVAAIPLCGYPLRSIQDGYARHIWHAEDGLPEETVQAFAQTPDHFLWIGTTGGLVRFDGAQFIVFNRNNTPALRENSIFSLLTASDGSLWAGTEGGGLVSYKDGIFRLWSKADGLTNGYIRALRQDHKGDIWIGTDDGLFRLHDSRIDRLDGRNGVPLSAIHAIYVDPQGSVWAGGFHFFIFDQNSFRELKLPGGLTDNVKSILQTRDGTVWVGTVSGLARMLPASAPWHFEQVNGIHSTVRTLLEDDEGTLWIGTIGEGIIRYQGGSFSRLAAGLQLPSNTILSSFLGAGKNIWVGTQTGLVRINRTAVNTLQLPDYADADFGTIYRDRDGSLWVGSSHLFHIASKGVDSLNLSGLGSTRVRTVFRDSTGALWFGTEGKGAYRLTSGAPRQIPNVQAYIRGFAEDHQGGIWIGTDGGYVRWTQQGSRFFEPHESVRALLVDHAGNVWVGKDRGLTCLRNTGFTPYVPINRLQSEKVWAIHEDPTGALWFGTRSSGLFRWKDGKLTAYTTNQGLASNSIFQVLEDRRATLWISGPNGVSSISRSDLEANARDASFRPAVKLYGTSDGLQTTQMYGGVQPAGCVGADGEVWFPSTAGPVRIGSDTEPSMSAPPAVIDRVIADGRDVRVSQGVDLPAGQGKLEIQYSAIQLRSQDRVRFQYQLEGFDHGWTETRVRRVVYANIPPGHYRFRLLAFDADQPRRFSEANVSFNWRPHLYQTGSFLVLSVACLLALAWATYKLRMQQVHARFHAVLEERNRLAREMHDTLIQGCTSVSALLEAMASMREEQLGSFTELLNFARSQIRETADEARRAVWNLRQTNGEEPAIDNLLERMTQQASFGSHIPVRFEASGKPGALNPLIEHDLVMIAREAVHNAVRHARPSEVDLKVNFEPGRISLRVLDDGCGFDPEFVLAEPEKHFGLVGMRERIERLGGQFSIRSEKGKGTQVSAEIPLSAA